MRSSTLTNHQIVTQLHKSSTVAQGLGMGALVISQGDLACPGLASSRCAVPAPAPLGPCRSGAPDARFRAPHGAYLRTQS